MQLCFSKSDFILGENYSKTKQSIKKGNQSKVTAKNETTVMLKLVPAQDKLASILSIEAI